MQDLNTDHIFVCKLTEKQDISWHACQVQDKPNIKMLIAINHGDNLVLQKLPQEKWMVPIAVVTSVSGAKILSILHQHPKQAMVTVRLKQPEVKSGQESVSDEIIQGTIQIQLLYMYSMPHG